MDRILNQKLYESWNQQWMNAEREDRITLLGRLMFRSKKKLLKAVIKDLAPESILEAGCGLGHTMSIYEELNLNYLGIDISSNAVEFCRGKNLHAVQKDIENVTQTYQLVSSDGMLEHFIDFRYYANHLMRVSNRYVLLIQPNHESFWGRTMVYLSEMIQPNKNVYEYNYRICDFINTFESNGFKTIRNLPIFLDVFRLLVFQIERCSVGGEILPPENVYRHKIVP